jgi:hypothetical protein
MPFYSVTQYVLLVQLFCCSFVIFVFVAVPWTVSTLSFLSTVIRHAVVFLLFNCYFFVFCCSAADNKRLQSSSSMEQLNTLSQSYSPRATYSTTIGT